jgi:hypothetical protein
MTARAGAGEGQAVSSEFIHKAMERLHRVRARVALVRTLENVLWARMTPYERQEAIDEARMEYEWAEMEKALFQMGQRVRFKIKVAPTKGCICVRSVQAKDYHERYAAKLNRTDLTFKVVP